MKSPLIVFLLSCVVAVVGYCAPTPPADVVFKPTFLTGFDSLTAGTGFIADVDGKFLLVTAHHLFGPAAGLEADLSPAQAKEFVAAMAISSMNRPNYVLTTSHMLLLPSAKAFSNEDSSTDIAVFVLEGYHGPSLHLAASAPEKGDAIYLYARPRGEEGLRIISGKVSRIAATSLEYFYDSGKFNFAGTSGAPVLNEKGEVVGINLGGGDFKGRQFGFSNPAISFTKLITEALKAEMNQAPAPGPSAAH